MPDRVRIGKMDRYLMAQSKVDTKTAKGGTSTVWSDAFAFFADQADVVTTETFSAIATIAPVTTTFITHFRTDLKRTMRIKQDADFWNIITIMRDGITMKIECQRMDD